MQGAVLGIMASSFKGRASYDVQVNLGRSRHEAELVLAAHVVQEGVFVGRVHDDGFMSKAKPWVGPCWSWTKDKWPPAARPNQHFRRAACSFPYESQRCCDSLCQTICIPVSPTEAYIVLAYIHIVIICISIDSISLSTYIILYIYFCVIHSCDDSCVHNKIHMHSSFL